MAGVTDHSYRYHDIQILWYKAFGGISECAVYTLVYICRISEFRRIYSEQMKRTVTKCTDPMSLDLGLTFGGQYKDVAVLLY